jgi:hypothetical protein
MRRVNTSTLKLGEEDEGLLALSIEQERSFDSECEKEHHEFISMYPSKSSNISYKRTLMVFTIEGSISNITFYR